MEIDDIKRIGQLQSFSSDKLGTFNYESQDVQWRNLKIPKGSREETIGDIDIFAYIAPPWKPHRVLEGGWGHIRRTNWLYGSPSAPQPLSITCDLPPTVFVGLNKNSNEDSPKGEVCFLLPASDRVDSIAGLKASGIEELIRLTVHYDDDASNDIKRTRWNFLPSLRFNISDRLISRKKKGAPGDVKKIDVSLRATTEMKEAMMVFQIQMNEAQMTMVAVEVVFYDL